MKRGMKTNVRRGWNRFLCTLLCGTMVTGMVPVTAFAAPQGEIVQETTKDSYNWQVVTTWEELKALLTEEQTQDELFIRLGADITREDCNAPTTWCVLSKGRKVLDLDGHTLKLLGTWREDYSSPSSYQLGFRIPEDSTLILNGEKLGSTVCVDDEHEKLRLGDFIHLGHTFDAFCVEKGGKLVVNGADIMAGSSEKQWMDRADCLDCDNWETKFGRTQIYGSAVQVNGGEVTINGGHFEARGTDLIMDQCWYGDADARDAYSFDQYIRKIAKHYGHSQAQNACVQITDPNSKVWINGGYFIGRGGASPIYVGSKLLYEITGKIDVGNGQKQDVVEPVKNRNFTPAVFQVRGGKFETSTIEHEILTTDSAAFAYDGFDTLDALIFRYNPLSTRHERRGVFGIPESALNKKFVKVYLDDDQVESFSGIKDLASDQTLTVWPYLDITDEKDSIAYTADDDDYYFYRGTTAQEPIEYVMGTHAAVKYQRNESCFKIDTRDMYMDFSKIYNVSNELILSETDEKGVLHTYELDARSFWPDNKGGVQWYTDLIYQDGDCMEHDDCGRKALGTPNQDYYINGTAQEGLFVNYGEYPRYSTIRHHIPTTETGMSGLHIKTVPTTKVSEVALSVLAPQAVNGEVELGANLSEVLSVECEGCDVALESITLGKTTLNPQGFIDTMGAEYVYHYRITADKTYYFGENLKVQNPTGAEILTQKLESTNGLQNVLLLDIGVKTLSNDSVYGKAQYTSGVIVGRPIDVAMNIRDCSDNLLDSSLFSYEWQVQEGENWNKIETSVARLVPDASLAGKLIRLEISVDGYRGKIYTPATEVLVAAPLAGTLTITNMLLTNGGFMNVKLNPAGSLAAVYGQNPPTIWYQLEKLTSDGWVPVENATCTSNVKENLVAIPQEAGLVTGDQVRISAHANGFAGEIYSVQYSVDKPPVSEEIPEIDISVVKQQEGYYKVIINNYDSRIDYRFTTQAEGWPENNTSLTGDWFSLDANMSGYIYYRFKETESNSCSTGYKRRPVSSVKYIQDVAATIEGDGYGSLTSGKMERTIRIPVGGKVNFEWECVPYDNDMQEIYFYLQDESGSVAGTAANLSIPRSATSGLLVLRGKAVGGTTLIASNVPGNPDWNQQATVYARWSIEVFSPDSLNSCILLPEIRYQGITIEAGDSYTPSVNPVTDQNYRVAPNVEGRTLSWRLAKQNATGAPISMGTDCEYATIDPVTGTITAKKAWDNWFYAQLVVTDAKGNAKELANYSVKVNPSAKETIFVDPTSVTLSLDEGGEKSVTLTSGYMDQTRTDAPDISYVTENPDVAVVDAQTGEVTAVGVGTTRIVVRKMDNRAIRAYCTVEVVHTHTYDEGIVVAQVNCLDDGKKCFTCTVCGDTYETPILTSGHHWTDLTITKTPTCMDFGEASHQCTECKKTETITLPVTEHNYSVKPIDGEKHATQCLDCGAVMEGTGEAHDLMQMVVKAPNNGEAGILRMYCSECGYSFDTPIYDEEVAPHKHDLQWMADENEHWKECMDESCPEKDKAASVHGPHNFVETTVDGKNYSQCSVCGTIKEHQYNVNFVIKSDSAAEAINLQVYAGDSTDGRCVLNAERKNVTRWELNTAAYAGSYYAVVSQEGHITQEFILKVSNSDVKKAVTLLRKTPVINSLTQSTSGVTLKWGSIPGVNRYRVYRKVGTDGTWSKLADVNDIKYVDRAVEKGKTYSYSVRCMNDEGTALTSAMDNTGKKITVTTTVYLDTPKLTGIKNTENGINLTWDAVPGATQYRVYYKGGDNTGGWLKLADVTGTSYNFTKQNNGMALTTGTTYTMTVKCINADKTAASEVDKVGLSIAYKPVSTMLATPVLTEIVAVENGVKISWNKVSGAAQYEVRKKDANGKWQPIAKTGLTQYTDCSVTSGEKCVYTVCCINAAGDKATSKYNTTGLSLFYMSPAKITTIANTADGIQIKWKASAGADRYRIYRKAEGGAYEMLKDVKDATSYVDLAVEGGKTYSYCVQPICMSPKTFGWYGDGKSMIRLEVPELKSVTNVAGGIKIKWTPVAGTEKYRIYRKEAGGEYKKLKDVVGKDYTDTTAVSGITYTYSVKALSMDGTILGKMDETGLTVPCVAQPKLISAQKVASGQIKITWTPVAGVDGYYVLKLNAAGEWEKVKTLTGAETSEYTHTAAEVGVMNTYTVRSYIGSVKSAYDAKGVGTKG